MTEKMPDLDFSWVDQDPGSCPECGEAWEHVRPGKSQPTCDCQDKCTCCGMMRGHFNEGVVASQMAGFLCPNCDSDDDKRPALIAAGILPETAIRPPRPWLGEDET